MQFPEKFDVIVVGGGHAGTEAALASARMGASTLLITHNIETIGQMSCNPAIGGIGKGHLVKEIDALGGIMAQAADMAGIQFRTLNSRKGPAVRATRAQADRALYKQAIRSAVESQSNLKLFQQPVEDLMIKDDKVIGVKTKMGLAFFAKTVILTVGTFLGGKIFIGDKHYQGGRAGDGASIGLAQYLRDKAFDVARLKTGTPPRIDGSSVDFSVLAEQPGDEPTPIFSYLGKRSLHPKQLSCYIAHTNELTHEIIENNLQRSAMFSGYIEGTGPRYCPSIEDKIVRFKEKTSHQVFVEPEGLDTFELYPNGLSTSLPFDVQIQFIRSMKGFEHAHITRPGYAIEYDYFDPRQLQPNLETKKIEGLFFAGQINGTTGYEEAAAQGLMAGINAVLKLKKEPALVLKRDEAYIGVLIDDLITHGTLEPYRMFTSRAEHRLLLREDNADLRLTPKGRQLGVVQELRWQVFKAKSYQIEQRQEVLRTTWLHPDSEESRLIETWADKPITKEVNALGLLQRPQINYQQLIQLPKVKQALADFKLEGNLSTEYQGVLEDQISGQIEVQAKYAGYIEKQKMEVARNIRLENTPIPKNFVFKDIPGLSNEVIEKLASIRPQTVAQAARIPGVTPAAISILLVSLKKGQDLNAHSEKSKESA